MTTAYLIVEPEILVAWDLEHAFHTMDPSALVYVFKSAEEALAALQSLPSVTAAVLNMPPEGFSDTELGQYLGEHGIPCGFTGTIAEIEAPELPVLRLPFSEYSVRAFISLLLQDSRS